MTQSDWKPQEPGEAPKALPPDAPLPQWGPWPTAKPEGWPDPWPPETGTPFLAAALEYAAKGWRVHPLVPGNKSALLKDWPEKATTDAATIFGWWAQWPNANVGLVPGKQSVGLAVVDVDPRNGGLEVLDKLRQAFAGQQLPKTQMVRTGSGGYHLYFDATRWLARAELPKHLGDPVEVDGKKKYGVEVHAHDNLNIVAPPSVHPGDPERSIPPGNIYQWLEPEELAPYPDLWLEESAGTVPGAAKPTPTQGKRRLTGNEAIDEALRCLDRLNPKRADDYGSGAGGWLDVGMALHAVSDTLLPQWEAWSRQSSTFDEGVCAEKWAGFKDKGPGKSLGLGSLREWADEDSLRIRWFDQIAREKVSFLWPGVVPFGKLTIFMGEQGWGKTYATVDLAARLSAGTKLPDGTKIPQAMRSLLVFCEDGAGDTVGPRLDASGANSKLVATLDVFGARGEERLLQLDTDLRRLEALIVRHGIKLLVLDPLTAYLGKKVNSWKDDDIRQLLGPVAKMADRTKVAIIGIMHLNKKQTVNVLQRATGAMAFTAVARSVILIGPHTEDAEKPRKEQRRVFAPAKANLGPEDVSRVFRVTDTGIAWEGTTETTAKDMVMVDMGITRTADKRQAAINLLRAELAGGPRLSKDLIALAKAQSISYDTLRDAKDELSCVVKQITVDGKNAWTWRLPDSDPEDGDLPPSMRPGGF